MDPMVKLKTLRQGIVKNVTESVKRGGIKREDGNIIILDLWDIQALFEEILRKSFRKGGAMSKFTAGPWRINKRASGLVENESGRSVASCGGYATNSDGGKYIAENAANARLIAAAPKMYDWMRRMAPSFDNEARSIMADIEEN